MGGSRIRIVPLVAVPILFVWHQIKPGTEHMVWRVWNLFRSKRSVYREQVLSQLARLASIDPRGGHHKIKDNPDVLTLIDAGYREDRPVGRTAISIATKLQSRFVETLDPDQRALVIRQLHETNAGQIAAALRESMDGRSAGPANELAYETVVLATSIFMAKALLDDGEIKESDYEAFWSSVVGPLSTTP